MNQTSPRVIGIVVGTIAFLACLCISVLGYCLIFRVEASDVLLTAFVGITTSVVGTLTGMLINTRSQPVGAVPTQIVNKPSEPVPVDAQN